MPLSEQEQRLLDEMERHLMNKDADVVAPREGNTISYRNIVYGAVLVLLGLAGVLIGVSTQIIAIGVIAFVVMVAGVVVAAMPSRTGSSSAPTGTNRPTDKKTPPSSGSFMDRMGDRWDRRQGDR